MNSPKPLIACLFALILFACNNKKDDSLSIVFTGDMLLDRGVRQQISKKGHESLFVSVEHIFKGSDYSIVNLECPLTGIISPVNKKYIFRADPECLPAIKNAGITHLNMANNHTNDQGREGIINTALNIENEGLNYIGYGLNSIKACEPVVVYKGSVRVALFCTVVIPLENWMPLSEEPGPCQMSPEEISENIHLYKLNNPDDFVVVSLHWGTEYHQVPSPEQRKMAHKLVDSGADAIIGHHPHVVQSISSYKGKPVFYSLGNFIFDQKTPETTSSIVVQMIFHKQKQTKFIIHPVEIKNCTPEIMKNTGIFRDQIESISNSVDLKDNGKVWLINN